MIITVNTIDAEQERKCIGVLTGQTSSIDPNLLEFNEGNDFQIGKDSFTIKGAFSSINLKGNLSVAQNGLAIINSLVTLNGTFLLMYRISDEAWIEITVSD